MILRDTSWGARRPQEVDPAKSAYEVVGELDVLDDDLVQVRSPAFLTVNCTAKPTCPSAQVVLHQIAIATTRRAVLNLDKFLVSHTPATPKASRGGYASFDGRGDVAESGSGVAAAAAAKLQILRRAF